jgi:hypothetical protein
MLVIPPHFFALFLLEQQTLGQSTTRELAKVFFSDVAANIFHHFFMIRQISR